MCRYQLLTVLLALPVPALAQWTSGIHDTGVVRFEVFDNGKLGAFYEGPGGTNFGEGFVFEGDQGLYEGAFLVGQDFDQVSGDAYDFPDVEWTTVSPITPLFPPGLGLEVYEAVYDDSAAPDPIGVTVTQRSYSHKDLEEPFVYVEFTVENTSGGDLADLYFGVFADWDVGVFDMNLGDFDGDNQLLYVWDPTGTSESYFGVAAIDIPDDVEVTGIAYDALPGDSILFLSLTVIQTPPLGPGADRRTLLGVGPYDLPTGASETVMFAFVAGASEAEIINNAELAQQGFGCLPPCPATEPSAEEQGIALHAASPNPARGNPTLSFTLDRPMPIRLSVHDALGREVAVLVEGERAAGEHAVTWEAAGHPAGVYLARLLASGTIHTRTVTLLR